MLPPSLRDWLPEKHLAYFVSDVVDHLDLSAMDAAYGTKSAASRVNYFTDRHGIFYAREPGTATRI